MSGPIPDRLRRLVRERGAGCCEYCLIHESDTFFSHEVDHIIPQRHGGSAAEGNLALSCLFCNRRKGSDIASIDPATGILTPLFNPRNQVWSEHFRLVGARIDPLSPEGRVTERILGLNHPGRLVERGLLRNLGRYPA